MPVLYPVHMPVFLPVFTVGTGDRAAFAQYERVGNLFKRRLAEALLPAL